MLMHVQCLWRLYGAYADYKTDGGILRKWLQLAHPVSEKEKKNTRSRRQSSASCIEILIHLKFLS